MSGNRQRAERYVESPELAWRERDGPSWRGSTHMSEGRGSLKRSYVTLVGWPQQENQRKGRSSSMVQFMKTLLFTDRKSVWEPMPNFC
ncbi:hypothetical protein AAFF_G00380770 [Aldrovandia affinis]|uniref:Uncharacterized protein n=1 Tax=Aldrovandia affinis TaxID=143900 RepID=A0AAD7X0S4_9TELE|nr:hypothetical protein AAFF_G00380770 [Aldrovandia affinis]